MGANVTKWTAIGVGAARDLGKTLYLDPMWGLRVLGNLENTCTPRR